jgi:hypothetical protein
MGRGRGARERMPYELDYALNDGKWHSVPRRCEDFAEVWEVAWRLSVLPEASAAASLSFRFRKVE